LRVFLPDGAMLDFAGSRLACCVDAARQLIGNLQLSKAA